MELNKIDNKINWNLILLFQELRDCLPKNDLIQLSLINKALRQRLKPRLFYHINFIKFPSNLDKFTYLKDIRGEVQIKAKVKQFIEEFKTISKLVIELSIGDYFNLYFLSSTTLICNNLTQLSFNLMHIPLTTMKKVLDNCKNLEGLLLQFVKVVEWTHSEFTINGLELPDNLKSLTIRSSFLERSPLESDPMTIDYIYYGRTLYISKLRLFNSKSNQLESIELSGYSEYDIIEINKFLETQTILISLSIQGNIINQETFDILQSLARLENFTISGSDYNTNWKTVNIPSLTQLKSLKIYYPSFYTILSQDFVVKFPNLNSLTILYNEEFIDEVLKHPGLRKLTIYYQFLTKFQHELPPNNLRYLEIGLNSPYNIDFVSLKHCKELRILKISDNSDKKKYLKEKLINYYKGMGDNWRVRVSSNNFTCYKLNT
ncbi:hypothetical protein CONCODRAFT_85159 [Conidiobolus coronatus NRRL 28638]|uniref:F-box domain-containing protein n=1 Tax=Conidiobolus coronatus (strain ATCC 28846 / CBS 209.66 / NRRL 28638) TaxID=796925 RepID=A0A137P6N6_CONC2|nr:hypothetical protein CONCODRAFT_85159 [Conidiobolus coronatus NRRL 28638]|eukprot:KXN70680.1 hypothetical protein CONCODRAFT_85159 [Conidiobolus coronatus NRRL 28638]